MKEADALMYMDFAHRVAERSRAKRLKVGAVLARGNQILAYSWNGTPPGWNNECEDRIHLTKFDVLTDDLQKEYPHVDEEGIRYKLVTKPIVIHAEENIIRKMAQSRETMEGASLFLTHNPCPTCSSRLVGLGLAMVYYHSDFRDLSGVTLLRDSGVPVTKFPQGNIAK